MQKESVQSDKPALKKRPKRVEILGYIEIKIRPHFGRFLKAGWSD
jgi:hypothetical protein